MKPANFLKVIAIALLFAFAIPAHSTALNANANSNYSTTVRDSAQDAQALTKIIVRVNEIQNMDKSNLSSAEKSDLRKELTTMKKEAKSLSSGVYVSVGAIIIGILLLILILR
jgi:hypothetical protein